MEVSQHAQSVVANLAGAKRGYFAHAATYVLFMLFILGWGAVCVLLGDRTGLLVIPLVILGLLYVAQAVRASFSSERRIVVAEAGVTIIHNGALRTEWHLEAGAVIEVELVEAAPDPDVEPYEVVPFLGVFDGSPNLALYFDAIQRAPLRSRWGAFRCVWPSGGSVGPRDDLLGVSLDLGDEAEAVARALHDLQGVEVLSPDDFEIAEVQPAPDQRRAIREMVERKDIDGLIEVIESDEGEDDWRLRFGAVAGICKASPEKLGFGRVDVDRRALPLLARLLRTDPETVVRRGAARALSGSSDPSAIPPLLEALDDPDGPVQDWAIWGLEGLKAREAVEPLLEIVRTGDRGTKSALRALVEIRDERALGPLRELQIEARGAGAKRRMTKAVSELESALGY